jgi:hypothetical protein
MTEFVIPAFATYSEKWYPGLEEALLEGAGLPRRALRGELTDREFIALYRYAEVFFPEELKRFCRVALADLSEEQIAGIRDRYRAAQKLHDIKVELLHRRSERRQKFSVVR